MTFEQHFIGINALINTLISIFEISDSSELAPTYYKDAFPSDSQGFYQHFDASGHHSSQAFDASISSLPKKPDESKSDDNTARFFRLDKKPSDSFSSINKNNIVQVVESCLKQQLSSHSGGIYDI